MQIEKFDEQTKFFGKVTSGIHYHSNIIYDGCPFWLWISGFASSFRDLSIYLLQNIFTTDILCWSLLKEGLKIRQIFCRCLRLPISLTAQFIPVNAFLPDRPTTRCASYSCSSYVVPTLLLPLMVQRFTTSCVLLQIHGSVWLVARTHGVQIGNVSNENSTESTSRIEHSNNKKLLKN